MIQHISGFFDTARNEPFQSGFPIRTLADVRRLEETPLLQALQIGSTYEIFCKAAAAYGKKTALSFLRTANLHEEPICWTYADLLDGIHQTANLLNRLGIGPHDAVAVLLPGCLEYHLALWGGAAAGIVGPLNPLLSDEKLISLMTAAQAKVLIAYGSDSESGIWSKAMRIRDQVPSLRTVLRVAPHDKNCGLTVPPAGVADFHYERSLEAPDHLVSGRHFTPTDIAA
jgi:fatty-acyl-CoA synthase